MQRDRNQCLLLGMGRKERLPGHVSFEVLKDRVVHTSCQFQLLGFQKQIISFQIPDIFPIIFRLLKVKSKQIYRISLPAVILYMVPYRRLFATDQDSPSFKLSSIVISTLYIILH
jgi:hypothetical protein